MQFLKLIFCIFFTCSSNLVSPWAELGKVANNIWSPKVLSVTTQNPEILAQAALVVDAENGDILYQKNEHLKLPVASLVKIMSVIVASENKGWYEELLISERAAQMEPDKMLLIAGERLSLEELLDGIFLVSANDAAEVLAEGIFNNRDQFIEQMNEKAKQLGMNNSLFINPTGLDEEMAQYSTAFDVALMSRYAIKNFPKLLDITSQPRILIPKTPTHQDYDLYSGINLLTTYPGVMGFKTGYTPKAGMCLVTVAKKGEKILIVVILNSDSRREDAKKLLDFAFKN